MAAPRSLAASQPKRNETSVAGQADEALGARTPMGADLAQGVQTLALDQEITFTRYNKLILPLDGYVFWIKAALMTASAAPNAAMPNKVAPNKFFHLLKNQAPTQVATGSLHYASDVRQEEAETYAANKVIFTSTEKVDALHAIAPNQLWIGEFEGLRFAFSSLSPFYQQADLWHYVGFAVYPDMATQIIDTPIGFDQRHVVVSNSLPAWLALNSYEPIYGIGNPGIPLFPSFLSPLNESPPFATIHVAPESTRALASAPTLLQDYSHEQLASEIVRITLWGTRNFNAQDFVDFVYQYSDDTDAFGIMNMPIIRDEKRTQSEMQTIAMKKAVEFEISYLQRRVRNIARQIIEEASVTFRFGS